MGRRAVPFVVSLLVTMTMAGPASAGLDELGNELGNELVETGGEVAEPLEPVTEPVTDPLEPVLEPVTDPLEPVLEPVTDPLDPILDPVSDPPDAGTGDPSGADPAPAPDPIPTTQASATGDPSAPPSAAANGPSVGADPAPIDPYDRGAGDDDVLALLLEDLSTLAPPQHTGGTTGITLDLQPGLIDRLLSWLESASGLAYGLLAGPLLALQVLFRALVSAGSGLVAPASLLAGVTVWVVRDAGWVRPVLRRPLKA